MGGRQTDELRLALLSLFAVAAEVSTDACAGVLDRATIVAAVTPAADLDAAGFPELTHARFGAARVLNSLCAACAACARGDPAREPLMAAPPPRPR